jgi:hypothetical protein
MAEKFTTFPDIPIHIRPVVQEWYDYVDDQNYITYNASGPITRKQLFDIYWTKKYSYTFSLKTMYGSLNEAGTKNSYTSVQRKGQTGAYLPDAISQYLDWPSRWEEDRESLGELNDSDPRKALITYVTATCQVATGDNFLAKGLCTNPFYIKKEASEEERLGAQPLITYQVYFGFGADTGFFAFDKKYAPVGAPFGATNVIKINPETDEFEHTDKYYLSPIRFAGTLEYQAGQYSEDSERIIRYWSSFSSHVKPPRLDPSRPNFRKIGNFKFYDLKPLEIWGDQSLLVYEKYREAGEARWKQIEESVGAFSVDFTVASSSKFDFEI